MNYLEFTVGMTQALAWPFALVCVFAILKRPITAAINRMKSLKHGEVEFTFAEKLEQAKAAAVDSEITLVRPLTRLTPALLELAAIEPRRALIAGWSELEIELRKLSDACGFSWNSSENSINMLKNSGFLANGQWEVLLFLDNIFEKVASDPTVIVLQDELIQFLMLCKSMMERVQSEYSRKMLNDLEKTSKDSEGLTRPFISE